MDTIKLLLVEDDPSLRYIVQSGLEYIIEGYEVLAAANGEEGLAMWREHRPDVILSDIEMPVMDGYDALRLIRERAPDIPVIALTAYAFETDRQRMFQAGFNECLAKPLRADELRSRIASLLSR